jgi:hypothetical protein
MDPNANTPAATLADPSPFRNVGFWAILAGGLAMVLVFAQIVAPSLEPGPSAGERIGEIAGEMKRAAWRSFLGLPKPEPEVQAVPMHHYLAMIAPVFGVLAVILAAVSGVKRENWRFATYGACLGFGAIVFQFLWWVALLVAGMVLLVAIIENLGEFFSF